MGIGDKVKDIAENVQEGVKTSTISMLTFSLRFISGFFLGLTLAFIGQELMHYGTFILMFVTVVIIGLFLKISAPWKIPHLLIFDLICVLVAQLLRMYILLAP